MQVSFKFFFHENDAYVFEMVGNKLNKYQFWDYFNKDELADLLLMVGVSTASV